MPPSVWTYTLHLHLMRRDIVPQTLITRTRRRKIYRSRLPFRRFFFYRAASLAVLTLGPGSLILWRIASRWQDRRVCSILRSTLVKDPARQVDVSKKWCGLRMMLYVPDSADMRIALKDLNIQPSFPKMNGSSHATDTRANDANGLDVEALISHCSEHCLVSINILYRCDRESSKKRK